MNPEPPAYIPHCYFHLVQEVLNFPDEAGTRIQQENHDVSISDNQTLQQNRFVLLHFFQSKAESKHLIKYPGLSGPLRRQHKTFILSTKAVISEKLIPERYLFRSCCKWKPVMFIYNLIGAIIRTLSMTCHLPSFCIP